MKILKNKGTIGIIAPGFYPDAEKLERGIDYLEKRGFKVKRGKSLTAKKDYFAGSDALRADDIHTMFTDSDVDAILCARGGWGSLRLLNKLDYKLINNNRKLLVGYSDITSLQLVFWKELSLPSLSGPMAAVEMSTTIDPFTGKHFWSQLLKEKETYSFKLNANSIHPLIQGKASGTLIGGCLSMITAQLASPYSPDYTDAILFIEDINESLYKIDRHLAQLLHAGVLEKIGGFIIGNFINYDNDSAALYALFKEYLSDFGYPVIANFPYGHSPRKISLPIGASCTIDTEKDMIEIGSCYENL
jgi:muramoyltetrapeptide carboxypeptidase